MCSVKTNVVLSGFPLTMAITYQLCLINRAIIPVSSESIQLPNDYKLELSRARIRDEALEFWALVFCPRYRSINIFTYNKDVFPLCPCIIITQLPFYGLLVLVR
jgi:hypothetical protein